MSDVIGTFRLDGCHAVVTGASRGIGKGCALALAGAGASLTLIGRTPGDLEAVADEIRALGMAANTLPVDVTDTEALADGLGALPRIDVFVNNAGMNRPQPFLEVEPATFDEVMSVNLRGAFFAAQAAARSMRSQGAKGSIIHMSSQAGHRALQNRSVYASAKHAIEGLTKAMAYELAEHSIRVNAVAPTFIETPMTKPFLEEAAFRDYVEAKIRLPGLGRIEDVASAVLYLASPAARMVTGTSLLVDGGWTCH